MVNLRTLFTCEWGRERPSLCGSRSEGGIVPVSEGSKGGGRTEEPRNSKLFLLKIKRFAEYIAKNTNSKIVQ
jgi:hypothetical protein